MVYDFTEVDAIWNLEPRTRQMPCKGESELRAMESKSRASQETCVRGRDTPLYVCLSTLNCVLLNQCIPCLYKIFPDGDKDRLFDYIKRKVKPVHSSSAGAVVVFPTNQRPELCKRSRLASSATRVHVDSLYQTYHSILTVGDGDFSFSLALANIMSPIGTSLVRPIGLTATSHESRSSVISTYSGAARTLQSLLNIGVNVLHGVDATNLAHTTELTTNKISKKSRGKGKATTGEEVDERRGVGGTSTHTADRHRKPKRYDRIVWNFPCISLPAGADGQATELKENQDLIRGFFLNAAKFLMKESGEVHLAHKTIEPFSWWNIKAIAAECGFDFQYAVIFDRCNYPGYVNRKALDKKSFPCNDAQIYVFARRRSSSSSSSSSGNNKNSPIGINTCRGDNVITNIRTSNDAAKEYLMESLVKTRVLAGLDDPVICHDLLDFLLQNYSSTDTDVAECEISKRRDRHDTSNFKSRRADIRIAKRSIDDLSLVLKRSKK